MAADLIESVEDAVEPLTIAPKQLQGMEMCRRKKFVLFSGPRYSAKSVGGLCAVCDHSWNTKHAEIAIVTVSQSIGLESGIWTQFVEGILPKYMALGQGMQWIKKPHTASVSKKPTCFVNNKYGGKTKIVLESLKDEDEVEARFKSKGFTMMYVPELSNFARRKTFDIWSESLRSLHLKDSDFLFLADTNPADEGDESWIYHIWFIHAHQTYEEYCLFQQERGLPVVEERVFLSFRDSLGLVEFEIADNTFASQQRVDELTARYAHDQDLYDRYIRGLWVKASSGALFCRQFRENIHVIGQMETPGNPEPEIMTPEESTWQLCTSWDPGNSANSAAVIFEKWFPNGVKGRPHFKVLDEVALIETEHTIDDFTQRVLERMLWWENFMGRDYAWKHWSDRSVFDTKEPQSNRYYYQLIHSASGGRIVLEAADRGKGSVAHRVDLLRRLLFEQRYLISRTRCPQLIQMLKSMPAHKQDPNVPHSRNRHKHIFDAGTYGVASEAYEEMGNEMYDFLRKATHGSTVPMVSIST